MKPPAAVFFTVVFLFVSAVASRAQVVYSVHPYAGGVTYEHDWVIGTPPYQFGLSQVSKWEDSRGLIIINHGREKELGGTQRRYYRVHFGWFSFSVRPLWLVAVVGVACGALLVRLISRGRMTCPRGEVVS